MHGKQCKACKRGTPYTNFSKQYSVNERNISILGEYFEIPLEFGPLCNKCYSSWYDEKRRPKLKKKKKANTSKQIARVNIVQATTEPRVDVFTEPVETQQKAETQEKKITIENPNVPVLTCIL